VPETWYWKEEELRNIWAFEGNAKVDDQKKRIDELKGEVKRLNQKHNPTKTDEQPTPENSTSTSSSSTTVNYYNKKIKVLEDNVRELHRSLNNKKQEETALLNDMEITGQAFEDMQEQNIRLMQQLREKDDANFKLMSEKIKYEHVQKILREEKDVTSEQVRSRAWLLKRY
jgi:hypothetical protein